MSMRSDIEFSGRIDRYEIPLRYKHSRLKFGIEARQIKENSIPSCLLDTIICAIRMDPLREYIPDIPLLIVYYSTKFVG